MLARSAFSCVSVSTVFGPLVVVVAPSGRPPCFVAGDCIFDQLGERLLDLENIAKLGKCPAAERAKIVHAGHPQRYAWSRP